MSDADRLKKKIEAVNLIYKTALWRQYSEYVTSLERYIADLRQVLAKLDDTDADEIKKIKAEIDRLTKEHAAAVEKARSLRPETQEEQAMAQPTPSPSPAQEVGSAKKAELPCNCPKGVWKSGNPPVFEDPKKNLQAGVIWCGQLTKGPNGQITKWPKLSAHALAERAAPILWFSPNEPLRFEDKKIPEPLPGDEESKKSGSPVVYYRISEMVLREKALKPDIDATELKLDAIKKLTLKYYFYYSEDRGFHGHPHDLESVRLDINFTLSDEAGKEQTVPDKATHYVAHISRVIGAAHGVTWYGNQLDIGEDEKDTSLPITLLVEEGKHATSPDRNADGSYSPGYDVNRRYTDAWGVRDLIGSGELGSAKYEGSMTKPRVRDDMIMVKQTVETDGACQLLAPYAGEHREALEGLREEDKYILKRAEIFETNDEREARFKEETKDLSALKKLAAKDSILGWMKSEKFGKVEKGAYVEKDGKAEKVEPKKTYGDGFFIRAVRFGLGVERNEEIKDAIPIAYRLEGRQHGITIFPPIFRYPEPFFGGYIVPKVNIMFSNIETSRIPGRQTIRSNRYSAEAMYTPSASRTFDWYASLGREWFRPGPNLGYVNRFVSEGGIRFRVDWKQLWGFRFGLRATGFSEARNPRFVIEAGTGAF